MKLLFNKPFKKVNKDLSFKSNSVHLSSPIKTRGNQFYGFYDLWINRHERNRNYDHITIIYIQNHERTGKTSVNIIKQKFNSGR